MSGPSRVPVKVAGLPTVLHVLLPDLVAQVLDLVGPDDDVVDIDAVVGGRVDDRVATEALDFERERLNSFFLGNLVDVGHVKERVEDLVKLRRSNNSYVLDQIGVSEEGEAKNNQMLGYKIELWKTHSLSMRLESALLGRCGVERSEQRLHSLVVDALAEPVCKSDSCKRQAMDSTKKRNCQP